VSDSDKKTRLGTPAPSGAAAAASTPSLTPAPSWSDSTQAGEVKPLTQSAAPVYVAPVDPLLGQILAGRYQIQRKLGEGGMGAVYLAQHTVLEKAVALKVLHGEFARKPDLVERFMQEARAASRIRHENVIDISDFGSTGDGLVFFAMELLNGHDLHEEIARARLAKTRLPWERSRKIFLQICSALAAAHSHGIVHRDLKPENIYLVEWLGHKDFVKLLDFGIAKLTEVSEGDRKLTRTGMLFGTPEYMSPEQARGENVDHRVDIYAMGCILYQLITGKVPFEAENFMGILSLHLTEPAPPIGPAALAEIGAPPELEAIIDKALAKSRADRWETIDAMANAIRALHGEDAQPELEPKVPRVQSQAPRVSAVARTEWKGQVALPTDEGPSASPARSKLPLVLGAVGLLAAGAVAAVVLSGGGSSKGGATGPSGATVEPGGGTAAGTAAVVAPGRGLAAPARGPSAPRRRRRGPAGPGDDLAAQRAQRRRGLRHDHQGGRRHDALRLRAAGWTRRAALHAAAGRLRRQADRAGADRGRHLHRRAEEDRRRAGGGRARGRGRAASRPARSAERRLEQAERWLEQAGWQRRSGGHARRLPRGRQAPGRRQRLEQAAARRPGGQAAGSAAGDRSRHHPAQADRERRRSVMATASHRTGRARVGTHGARDLELAYDVFDGGPRRLVLIMGIGAQRVFWDDRLCARLADRGFAVVRFDHRDLGESSRLDDLPAPRPGRVMARALLGLSVPAPYTLSAMAGDVIGLCDHLGWDRVHVVGASMGGMIAQHLGFEHGHRLASLTSIMSTTGARRYAVMAKPAAMRALLGKPPRTADEAGEHAVRLFTALGGPRFPADSEALRTNARVAFERGPSPRGFCRHFAAIGASGDRTARLAAVKVPTLVVHGSHDPLIPAAAGRATARAIAGARLHVIDGMGHHLPPGSWDELGDAIDANAARA
jgi:serine/threonine protein kinase/pimeloyl-ACP methyl ester carboxylesterase